MTAPRCGRRRAQVADRAADERGATLALTALVLTALVTVAALVVDVGGNVRIREGLAPATDAAALAASQELAKRPWDTVGACTAAHAFLAANAPEATLTACEPEAGEDNTGRITVSATQPLEGGHLRPLADGAVTGSTSSAAWGAPLAVEHLRPLALCYQGSAGLRQLIDDPPTSPQWTWVGFVPDLSGACGGSPLVGNFLTVDFQGGAGLSDVRSWLSDGYPDAVTFDPDGGPSCDGDAVCYQRPYAMLDLGTQLSALRSSQRYVSFPLYDYADADQVHLVGSVRARLYDYYLSGYSGSDGWWLQLKVDPGLVTGPCCGPAGLDGGSRVIALCAVEPATSGSCGTGAGA